MDTMDDAIIKILKENGRASASAIGKMVNLSIPAVLERIKKLTRAGIIEGYTVKINRAQTGRKLLAFVFLHIDGNESIQAFRNAVVKCDCVLECHHMAGSYDYLLKVAVEDTEVLEHFLTGELKTIKGVTGTNTMIALATMKEEINV